MRDHQKAEKRKKYEVNETLTSVVPQEDIQRGVSQMNRNNFHGDPSTWSELSSQNFSKMMFLDIPSCPTMVKIKLCNRAKSERDYSSYILCI